MNPNAAKRDEEEEARLMKIYRNAQRMIARCVAGLLAFGMTADAAALGGSQRRAILVDRIKVHGQALEGNLEGNDPNRDAWVVLPPSYAREPSRRYPVVYALHGYTSSPAKWFASDKLEQRIANAYAAGAREMILVFPDSETLHGGSMYSRSITTGDWETFITRDLVSHIDAKYRTIARRESRGLMGHSMGGYGTARLGMKYPGSFSSMYVMSACCLSARAITPEQGRRIEEVKTREDAVGGNFLVRATLAVSSSWSPNPAKPPFFADLPTQDGKLVPRVLAEWAANSPLAMLPQHVPDLRRYHAIAIDVGNRDGLIGDNRALHDAMDRFGIRNSFEIYDGDHGSGVSSRFEQKVLPFFSANLRFDP
jgi:enterochelin esterase-like enzyme